MGTDLLQAKWCVQSDRLALDKSAHILASDKLDVVTELLLVRLDQLATMPDLLLAHLFKHLCSAGKVFPQVLAIIGVNTFILVLQGNGKGEDFFLG